MVNICVHYPKQCAQYLTGQFYDRGYTLTQRLDILHVLVATVEKLSNPNEKPIFDQRLIGVGDLAKNDLTKLKALNYIPDDKATEELKNLVKKRISEKTKIKSVVIFLFY